MSNRYLGVSVCEGFSPQGLTATSHDSMGDLQSLFVAHFFFFAKLYATPWEYLYAQKWHKVTQAEEVRHLTQTLVTSLTWAVNVPHFYMTQHLSVSVSIAAAESGGDNAMTCLVTFCGKGGEPSPVHRQVISTWSVEDKDALTSNVILNVVHSRVNNPSEPVAGCLGLLCKPKHHQNIHSHFDIFIPQTSIKLLLI